MMIGKRSISTISHSESVSLEQLISTTDDAKTRRCEVALPHKQVHSDTHTLDIENHHAPHVPNSDTLVLDCCEDSC